MKLKKRISLILTVMLALSSVLLTAGCGEKTEGGKEPPLRRWRLRFPSIIQRVRRWRM